MRILPLSLLTFALASLPALAQQDLDLLRVGSWNIESVDAGSATDARVMAQHLAILHLDVLVLTHIRAGSGDRSPQLDAIFELVNEYDQSDWRYRLFPNKAASDRTDLVGIAWNGGRVQADVDVFKAAVDGGDLWDKPPHAVKFSAGSRRTDFVVLPVQMDPKRTGNECLSGRRGQEAADLANHIEAAGSYFDDADLIVIGDTECVRDDAEKLAEFEAERALDFEVGDVAAFTEGHGSFNRVMVPTNQPEFAWTRSYSMLEAETQKQERPLSDHFLLLSPIRILADDD